VICLGFGVGGTQGSGGWVGRVKLAHMRVGVEVCAKFGGYWSRSLHVKEGY